MEFKQPQNIPITNPCQNISTGTFRYNMKTVKNPTISHIKGSIFFVKPITERIPTKIPNRESERISAQFILSICGRKDNE